jgi:hypothetical protein
LQGLPGVDIRLVADPSLRRQAVEAEKPPISERAAE